ncbi:MAG: TonB-dependent receptor plug domain-containing protein, partial [Bacteroidales bacterium]|nr:TonB-dependent receptor plug domain-containing protein [Bacteroidales bacterium]
MIKLFIRSTRKLLAITLVCLCALPLFAQNSVTVSGSLTDASNGDPLIGAYLIVKDSGGLSAVTDLDGKFSISIPASLSRESVVEINYVGYETRTLTVADILSSSLIKMSPLGEVLEEVLVVGYGVQKKASSVGSITQAKGEELLKTGNVNTVSEAMQGRLNGVISINTTGQPGANSATIFIRGKSTWQNTNPLVLVDGIERDMNDVDFNEIESVSVLKDASATAVYGVRGGNGVILLTTKRGDQDRPTVNFNTNVSLKEPTANIYWADYMTSMQLYNEGLANDQNWNSFIPQSTLNAWQNAFDTGNYGPYNDYFPQIDWYGEMIREAVSRNYNINVNGRSDFMKYFASVGYQFDDSIYNTQKQDNYDPRSWYKRLNWRANFDFDLTPTTTFSVGIAGKMGIRNTNFFGGVINLLARAPTNTFPIKWSDGYFGDDSNRGANPIADLNYGGQSQFQSFQGWYDAKLVQKLDFITEGLKAHA